MATENIKVVLLLARLTHLYVNLKWIPFNTFIKLICYVTNLNSLLVSSINLLELENLFTEI